MQKYAVYHGEKHKTTYPEFTGKYDWSKVTEDDWFYCFECNAADKTALLSFFAFAVLKSVKKPLQLYNKNFLIYF